MIGITYGYYVKNGGISRYISEYSKRLQNPKDFEIVTLDDSIKQESPPVRLVTCERDTAFMSITENAGFSKVIGEISKDYAAIHSHGIYDINPYFYTAHICLQEYFNSLKQFFSNTHDINEWNMSQMLRLEENLVTKLPEKRIIAVSDKVASELSKRYGLDCASLNVIKGASRFRTQNTIDNSRANSDGRYTVGFIGNNLYAKGIVFIKDALEKLESKGINVRCKGAGCNEVIRDFMTTNSSFRSTILGKIDVDENFYKSLDVLLCLSTYECYSLSALEAMSLHVPVISSDLNGLFDDNKSLTLARINDISDTSETATMIERIFTDEKYRETIIRSGINISDRWSWKDSAIKYDELYGTVS